MLLVLLLALGLGSGSSPTAAAAEGAAAALLAEAIRFRTVNPPGDEQPLAEWLVGHLRAGGLEAALVQTPPGASTQGRAAAWAKLAGRGGRAPLVLLSHLDVVPADARHWKDDPFAGQIRDGQVIGRGAQDAKGIAIMQLLAVLELARRGTPPERDIIFLATPDEESGGVDGAGYLTRERPDLLGDAGYLLTEGGGVALGTDGRPPVWGVAITEKNPCWLELVAKGSGGHSSVPPRDAAVPRLLRALERVRALEWPVRVTPEVERMFRAMAPLAATGDALGYADLSGQLESDAGFRSRFLAERHHAALVRTTLAITVLRAGLRTNVVPVEARAQIDLRLLPGDSCAVLGDRIRRAIADPGVHVETLLSFASKSSAVETPLFRAIEAVADATDPGAVVVPRVVAGFTDAHYFRELGITAYGFVPRWHRADELRGIHGADESISIENLERGVATLVAILDALDRAEDAPEAPAAQGL